MSRRRRWGRWPWASAASAVAALAVAALACSLLPAGVPGLATPAPAAAATTAAAGQTPAGPTPTASLSSDLTVTQTLTFGSGPFTLGNPEIGLADLSSYTATLAETFDGTVQGQPAKWSRVYVLESTQTPAARQVTLATTGDVSDTAPLFIADVDGAEFERRGQGLCTANALGPGKLPSSQLEPAAFLNFVVGADAAAGQAGSETVNGVATTRYTFDERALGQQGLTQATGELWMAADGSHLVKYQLTTTGDAAYFGQGVAGTLTEDYELTGVGQPLTVTPPADCPGGMIDAPLLPGATNESNTPGVLSYDTSASVADAVAFYQKQLPGLGWQPGDPPDISATEAALDFVKGSVDLNLAISSKAGVTTVTMMLVPVQT